VERYDILKIGVVRTSHKENERRVPIYPEHLSWIPVDVCKNTWFETGYGGQYLLDDEYLTTNGKNCLC
jgi:N5-(carboxyethyl)ornithine synthase